MNTHQIKIVGKIEIESPLNDEHDFSIAFKRLGVRKIEKIPSEDGNYTYVYSLGNLDSVTLITEDKIITGKAKKQSQRLRNALYYLSKDRDEDESEFYDKFMNKLVVPENLEKVASLLLN